MPQPALHILLARRMLDRWRREPARAPFRLNANGVEDHFLQGSLAPDMGLFPGSDPHVSRLVHTRSSGTMVRALFADARTDAERAFAWGWLTHVLADVAIHPIVNEFGDRLLARDGVGHPDSRDRGLAHVRVELGLDAWYVGRSPELRSTRVRHAFDARRIQFLHGALLATYAVPFPPRRLLRSHRNVTRFYRLYLLLARLIAIEVGAAERRGVFHMGHVRSVFRRIIDPASQAAGFLSPVPPEPEMIARIDHAVDRLPDTVEQCDVGELPDYDLETGIGIGRV